MDLFTTYIQRGFDDKVADKILEPSKKILSEIEDDGRYKYGKTSFYNLKIWKKYENEFTDLYDLIFKNAYAYCEKLQMKNIENISLQDIWVSEMYKYGSHKLHGHVGSSSLSGNFYVHVEPNSADIVFNRHEFMNDPLSNYDYKEYNRYNSNEWRFPAEKGGILIWKSDLPHSVDLNMSDSRIAISFNLKLIAKDDHAN